MWKRYLIAGLLIWAPLGITIWVLGVIFSTMDQTLLLLPPSWRPDALLGFHIPGFGVILSAVIVMVTGVLAANILGQQLVEWWEGLLQRIPIVRSIYSSVKQVSDTLFSTGGNSFRKAVLVEFPQRGQWTVGFLVGAPGPRVAQLLPPDMVSVYVPTAPNPTSGYTIIVPAVEVRELDISVDEALKFVISLGVVAPGSGESKRAGRGGGSGGATTLVDVRPDRPATLSQVTAAREPGAPKRPGGLVDPIAPGPTPTARPPVDTATAR
jgi:uncharacterized membrane protein